MGDCGQIDGLPPAWKAVRKPRKTPVGVRTDHGGTVEVASRPMLSGRRPRTGGLRVKSVRLSELSGV